MERTEALRRALEARAGERTVVVRDMDATEVLGRREGFTLQVGAPPKGKGVILHIWPELADGVFYHGSAGQSQLMVRLHAEMGHFEGGTYDTAEALAEALLVHLRRVIGS